MRKLFLIATCTVVANALILYGCNKSGQNTTTNETVAQKQEEPQKDVLGSILNKSWMPVKFVINGVEKDASEKECIEVLTFTVKEDSTVHSAFLYNGEFAMSDWFPFSFNAKNGILSIEDSYNDEAGPSLLKVVSVSADSLVLRDMENGEVTYYTVQEIKP